MVVTMAATFHDGANMEELIKLRLAAADRIAEEALAIADTPHEGVTITVDADGRKEVREDMLGHRKLQVDTRLRLLAKWNSGRYGDKLEHSGEIKIPALTEEQRTARLVAIMLAARGRKKKTPGTLTQSGTVDDGDDGMPENPQP